MKCILKNRALVSISGADAEEFLQNQLSNDILKLDYSHIQMNAYCQHQGKIIALFWLMRSDNSFLISFPIDLLDTVISRLQMFVIMSDVIIEDVTNNFIQVGLINEIDIKGYLINEKMSLSVQSKKNDIEVPSNNQDEWLKSCIISGIPEVFLSTSEKLVPQMLNLDIDEFGVNFSKGCYPGQEVVARLHYLGEAKRRLFSFKSDSKIQIGDYLYCASSQTAKARGKRYKGSGIVVNSIKYNSIFYCLATLDIDLLDSNITLNNKHGAILKIINNE
jgi:folate-binding protein YgfZ